MSVCESEPVGLGLPSHPPPLTAAGGSTESLNVDFASLKISEDLGAVEAGEDDGKKPSDGGYDQESAAIEEKSECPSGDPDAVGEENVRQSEGWGQELTVTEEYTSNEVVVVNGWGWDDDVTASEGNSRSEETNEVVVDGWGCDQEAADNEEKGKVEKERKMQKKMPAFPVRSNEPDCAFYMKMGTCRFGMNCKFNHPANRTRNKMKARKPMESVQVELSRKGTPSKMVTGHTDTEMAPKEFKRGTDSESSGQIECKYFSTPGGCKFGNSCKYVHNDKPEVPVELNFLGLPKRPGQKECTYYMSTGSCKYSTNCRFHHPDPTAVGAQGPSGYQNVESPQQLASPAPLPMTPWPMQRIPNEPVPYIDSSPPYLPYYLPPHGFHPNPDWNGYQAPMNPMFPTEMHMQQPQPQPQPQTTSTIKDTTRKGNGVVSRLSEDNDYPERPGQPECLFFMKTGSCKFRSACKFHHPKSSLRKAPGGADLSPMGLPVRPGQPTCNHFSRHNVCKYGQACRYNHPTDSIPPEAPESATPNAAPDACSESAEIKSEDTANPPQNSEW